MAPGCERGLLEDVRGAEARLVAVAESHVKDARRRLRDGGEREVRGEIGRILEALLGP